MIAAHGLTAACVQESAHELNNQMIQLYRQGRYSEAVPIAQRAVELRRKQLGEDHPDYATSLNNLAFLYDSMGEYAKAGLTVASAGSEIERRGTRNCPE